MAYPDRSPIKTPAAIDDICQKGFPCFGEHQEGTLGQNQHAQWRDCQKCGIRMYYASKSTKPNAGCYRHMGPEPGVLQVAMKALESEMEPSQVTATVVAGKIMEVKGKMLQMGLKTTMSRNVTYEAYLDRLTQIGATDPNLLKMDNVDEETQKILVRQANKPDPKKKTSDSKLMQLIKKEQAATGAVKKKEIGRAHV